jgi:hypothetical protein
MVDLEAGGHGLYVYGDASGRPAFLSAWPLPESVSGRRGLSFLYDAREQADSFPAAALAGAALVGETLLHALPAASAAREAAREKRRNDKRFHSLLDRLDQEERRLTDLLALREDACRLQAHLWRFAPEERQSEVLLPGEEGLPPCRIALDPLLSVKENMRLMFRNSARGARGLAILRERRRALPCPDAGEILPAEAAGPASCPDSSPALPLSGARDGARHPSGPEKETVATPPGGKRQAAPKDIASFRSSDGYTLLRGKNAQGNRLLLTLGRPYDLWLHTRDGPSAHLIIRRAHAKDAVPEQTLREAAVLVGLKSRQRSGGKAEIMVAFLRHVHAVRGAAPGTVRVDRELPGITVTLPRTEEE